MPDHKPIILATPHADGVRLDPQEYLGPRFGSYREAISGVGATYAPGLKANLLVIERLPALRAALATAGFELAVDDRLREALKEAASEAAIRAEAGEQRLAEAESRLGAGVSLFPYQRDGVRWLAPRNEALLGDEMGLGKTIQALMALPAKARVLVVAPNAVAVNWVNECLRWRSDLAPSRIASRATWRWPAPGEMLVATYGSLPAEDQELSPPPADLYVIADEAHMLKGSPGRRQAGGGFKGGTQRVRRWQVVRDAAHSAGGTVWLLTGTPLLNRPQELWRVVEAAGAGAAKRAFGSWPKFCEMMRVRRGRFGTDWSQAEASPEVATALQTIMLRRERSAVLPDLPRKMRQIETTPIADERAIAACDELVAVLEEAGKGPEDLLQMGKLPTKVREVVFQMLSKVRAALALAKTPRALELAAEYEEAELPVVFFSAHVAPLKALAARKGWGLIDGSVSTDERARVVQGFQDGTLRGIACSFAAGGVGITLTRAHHVVCVDQPWTPALLQQAEDRCARIGQEADSVHVRILAADHAVDARVAELLIEKTRLIEATVEAASVEEVKPDAELANRAKGLADLAESTVEVARRVLAEKQKREADLDKIRAGEADRRQGIFAVGAVPDNGTKRGPRDYVEAHAAGALVKLARLDPDHAAQRNDVGFSAFDGEFGHSLAEQLVKWGRLSDKQWSAACNMARRYRRQVGEPQPEGR